MATAMVIWVRRRPHAETSGRFRLSPGDVKIRGLRRVMGTSMDAWMPLPSPWGLFSITRNDWSMRLLVRRKHQLTDKTIPMMPDLVSRSLYSSSICGTFSLVGSQFCHFASSTIDCSSFFVSGGFSVRPLTTQTTTLRSFLCLQTVCDTVVLGVVVTPCSSLTPLLALLW